jgi:flagellar secretion chaperone FliS
MNAAYQTYRETQAQTAAPGELIVMLYRGAVRFVVSGIEGIEAQNVETSHNNLLRAQAVINELHESIDVERGGEVARNLWRLYEFMISRLVDANLRKDAAPAREVERLLRDLLPAWEEAARQTNSQPTRPTVGASA